MGWKTAGPFFSVYFFKLIWMFLIFVSGGDVKIGILHPFPEHFPGNAACQAPGLVLPGGISTPQNQLKKQGRSF